MLYRLKNKLNYYTINQLIKPLIKSSYLEVHPKSEFIIVTQLCGRDIYLYLVAILTFSKIICPKKIVIINDGSLNVGHLNLLRSFIKDVEFINIGDIDTGYCPRGGTWERLVLCCKLSKETYVVQLDADTITTGNITEVVAAILNKQSFILGTYQCSQLQTLEEASQFASKIQSESIQIQAEKFLVKLGKDFPNLYMRACSGFAGFNSQIPSINLLEKFSNRMKGFLGSRWNDWGSEQFASNYLLSNSSPVILAEPKYQNYSWRSDVSSAEFLHFIGNYRFHNRTLKKVILNSFRQ